MNFSNQARTRLLAGLSVGLYMGLALVAPHAHARVARIVIDQRQGTVVAGGDLTLGPGVVSIQGLTLSIASSASVLSSINLAIGSVLTSRQCSVRTIHGRRESLWNVSASFSSTQRPPPTGK